MNMISNSTAAEIQKAISSRKEYAGHLAQFDKDPSKWSLSVTESRSFGPYNIFAESTREIIREHLVRLLENADQRLCAANRKAAAELMGVES